MTTLYAWQVMLAAAGLIAVCAAVLGQWRRAGLALILFGGVVVMRMNAGHPEWAFGFTLWAVLAIAARRLCPEAGLVLLVSAACYPLEIVPGWGWSAQVVSNGMWWGALSMAGGAGGILALDRSHRGPRSLHPRGGPVGARGALALATERRLGNRPLARDRWR